MRKTDNLNALGHRIVVRLGERDGDKAVVRDGATGGTRRGEVKRFCWL
jgi:hypothetical protein